MGLARNQRRVYINEQRLHNMYAASRLDSPNQLTRVAILIELSHIHRVIILDIELQLRAPFVQWLPGHYNLSPRADCG